MVIDNLLNEMVDKKAISIFLIAESPPVLNIEGRISPMDSPHLLPQDIDDILFPILTPHQRKEFEKEYVLNFSFEKLPLGRFKVSIFLQRGTTGAIFRRIPERIPNLEELNLPPVLRELTHKNSGLILVTGSSGSGKSTTLACLIDMINSNRRCHIITIEDPIEYTHTHRNSIISQREIGTDSLSFLNALKQVTRQDPDVIFIGELMDLESISTALTTAESGHLIFGTLAATDTIQALGRIIEVFPSEQQQQVRTQLSITLQGIISQQLLIRADGKGRIPAVEIMLGTLAIRNLIREANTPQIYSEIEMGQALGMHTMEQALEELCEKGLVSYEEVISSSIHQVRLSKKLEGKIMPDTSIKEGEDKPIPITRELICYKSHFEQGQESYWNSSGNIAFTIEGLKYTFNPLSSQDRCYITDFSVVSGVRDTFHLSSHIYLRYKSMDIKGEDEEPNLIHFELYTGKETIKIPYTGEDGMSAGIPILEDGKWHNIIFDVPQEFVGKHIRIYSIEFSNRLTSIVIGEIVFF